MSNEFLLRVQHFFEVDSKIKREMYNMDPPVDLEKLDNSVVHSYADDLNDFLNYAFSELKCIAVDICGYKSTAFDRVYNLELIIKNNFNSCNFDVNSLKSFYNTFISNMSIDFIDSVKNDCIGNSSKRELSSIKKAFSINEILHFFHSYILNNENVLQSIPVLKYKRSDNNYSIKLRGVRVPVFEQLFNSFPTNLDCGWVEMASINNNKFLMMVDNSDSILTFEISLYNDIATINYVVPKISNIEIIDSLPGVEKYGSDSSAVSGIFKVGVVDLNYELLEFVSKLSDNLDTKYKKM